MSKLIVSERGKEHEREYELLEPEVTIGRHEESSIVLPSPGVSRKHVRIVVEKGSHLLVDLGSGNGTKLNGKQLEKKEKHLLRHGDVISIDAFDIRFLEKGEKFAETYEEEATETDILEVKLLKTVLAALDRETVPSFEVLNGTEEGKKVYLTDEMTELVIGRDHDCSFPIREHVISRRHAKIMKRWGGIAIRDLDSKNGIFLNNRRIVEEQLHDGDRLALGTIVLMFRNPQEINLAQMEAVHPRYRPAPISAKDVPLAEGATETPKSATPAEGEEDVSDAVSEWEKLESQKRPAPYPQPKTTPGFFKRFTPLEIGMIGLGSLVLIFALVTLVNLLFA